MTMMDALFTSVYSDMNSGMLDTLAPTFVDSVERNGMGNLNGIRKLNTIINILIGMIIVKTSNEFFNM